LLLTVKEAAALMRIGRDTTYSLVAQRRIPCVKLGK
jgi:excisionase family DNA binding protein